MQRNTIPKSSEATKTTINNINNCISEETPTPFILRPKFKKNYVLVFTINLDPGKFSK